MHWTIICARFLLMLIPALALSMPTFGQERDPRLSDSQEPGSAIVFPKFVQGAVMVDGVLTPLTEVDFGVVCPVGNNCPEHQSVRIKFSWVCPGDPTLNDSVCKGTDFEITVGVNEKAVFSPDGVAYSGVTNKIVPKAACPRGYLIGWVVDNTDQPIKFDGLIGNTVLRVSSTAISSFNAIPIQANPSLTHQGAITLGSGGALVFDGGTGHYQAVTGAILGNIKYVREVGTGGIFNTTSLILLTLDVQSNRPNQPVFVDLDFFGGTPSLIGGGNPLSTFAEFTCWGELQLDTDINENLNVAFMGRKGNFVSDAATLADGTPVSLLGLVQVIAGPAPAPSDRTYITGVYNDSIPVNASFVP